MDGNSSRVKNISLHSAAPTARFSLTHHFPIVRWGSSNRGFECVAGKVENLKMTHYCNIHARLLRDCRFTFVSLSLPERRCLQLPLFAFLSGCRGLSTQQMRLRIVSIQRVFMQVLSSVMIVDQLLNRCFRCSHRPVFPHSPPSHRSLGSRLKRSISPFFLLSFILFHPFQV